MNTVSLEFVQAALEKNDCICFRYQQINYVPGFKSGMFFNAENCWEVEVTFIAQVVVGGVQVSAVFDSVHADKNILDGEEVFVDSEAGADNILKKYISTVSDQIATIHPKLNRVTSEALEELKNSIF